jgi:hypothetical protein
MEEHPMDELVKLVAAKTGIPEDKARMAVELVVQHLKGRLPGGLGSQLDSALSGEGGGGALGGLLGKI